MLVLGAFCAELFAQSVKLPYSITGIAVDSDGALFAAAGKKSVVVFDASSFERRAAFSEKDVADSLFSKVSAQNVFITMTNAGAFRLHSLESDSITEEYSPTDYAGGKKIRCSAFSRNYIAAAFSDYSIEISFKLHSKETSTTRTLTEHTAPVYALAFSADEKYLASVSKDGSAYIWDTTHDEPPVRIEGAYVKSKIPVCFTTDSANVLCADGPDSFAAYRLTGERTARIETGRKITALRALTDPDTVAVLHGDAEITVYRLSRAQTVDVITLPPNERSRITAFAFAPNDDSVFVGCKNGAVYRIFPPSKSKSEANAAGSETTAPPSSSGGTAAHGKLRVSKNGFLNIGAVAGFFPAETIGYRFPFGGEVAYRTHALTPPAYEGIGLRALIALPELTFPVRYEDFDGNPLMPPALCAAELYLPAGIEVALGKTDAIVLFEECALTGRLSALINPGVAASKSFFSFGGRIATGIAIKSVSLGVAVNYDSIWQFFPELTVGGRIDFKTERKRK